MMGEHGIDDEPTETPGALTSTAPLDRGSVLRGPPVSTRPPIAGRSDRGTSHRATGAMPAVPTTGDGTPFRPSAPPSVPAAPAPHRPPSPPPPSPPPPSPFASGPPAAVGHRPSEAPGPWRPPAVPSVAAPDAARPLLEPQVQTPGWAAPAPALEPRASRGVALELLWFDEDRAEDLGDAPDFAEIVEFATPPKPAPKRPSKGNFQRPERSASASPRELFWRAVRTAPLTDLGALRALVSEALRSDDQPTMPMVLVDGTLSLSLDPRKELETVAALARSVAEGHKSVADELARADEVLMVPGDGAAEVMRRMTQRIRHAWRHANRSLPDDYLTTTSERSLLVERAYHRVGLLGATWLRAELASAGSTRGRGVVAYLPESLATRLPLYLEMRVRLVVDVLPRQDMVETSPVAVGVVAMARDLSDES